ncbi:MAG TPA: bifunctional diaminohydroxyphosphoribosylaminopyrimidine deaminase/5-amino-6-(5-phosphoribosylamino)uracil reductase RibD [Acidimicrobiales bacterium]|nr:bifunctional diaminohydroxyphosphoribosylaminopyrimidine deaminase/5-amino-6-(5-phosphoribosylamino)uracil reductase RibD [Acidimicrobiales bacterium]
MDDEAHMRRAVALAATVRDRTAPNPWVGSVVVPAGSAAGSVEGTAAGSSTSTPSGAAAAVGPVFEGATAPPGGAHAEVAALAAAGDAARGATLYVTLEPCAHQGRTPPCTDAIVAAGVARVVVGIEDPDPQVAGRGIEALRSAGIDVEVGVAADEVAEQLAPYLKHRTTGQPWVVLKMAASLDGRTAAPDGTSRWITGETARRDVHQLRASSDAVLVGAGTVRADDPELTVRLDDGVERTQPLRVVLGTAPKDARVQPALELSGDLDGVLSELGERGVLQLLVEGGPSVAHEFHAAGLVDRYVVYLAPVFFGGDDARPLFAGHGAGTIDDVWKGRVISVQRLGDDLRVEVAA